MKKKKLRTKSGNIGQYLYKNQIGILEDLFPEKEMKDIRKIIRYEE